VLLKKSNAHGATRARNLRLMGDRVVKGRAVGSVVRMAANEVEKARKGGLLKVHWATWALMGQMLVRKRESVVPRQLSAVRRCLGLSEKVESC
jgi:hypothetical protein